MVALVLGSFVFTDFALPEGIPLGGEQAGHLHKLPGGIRIFDDQGPDDDAISWSGRFRGSSALDQALQLEAMKRQGGTYPLSILNLSYTVVIKKFIFNPKRPFEVDYSIELLVISNNTLGVDSTIPSSLDSLVGQDIAAGLDLLGDISSACSLALSAFSLAVDAVPSLQESGAPQLQPVKIAAFALQAALNAAQAQQDEAILSSPVASDPIDTGPQNMLATLAALENEVALLDAGAYLGRAAVNVINATG